MTGTQERLLNTAKELFWKYGLKRVTVEEICQEAGVSKMTFYRNYPNKLAIARDLLEQVYASGRQDMLEIFNSDQSFIEKMEAIIQLKIHYSESISVELIQDIFSYEDAEFQSYVRQQAEEQSRLVLDFFREAQRSGAIRPDLKLEIIPLLSEHLLGLSENKRFMEFYDSPAELVKEITTFFFFGITSRPKQS